MALNTSGKVEYLSDPQTVDMADEWYAFVNSEHFWMRWRLDALLKYSNLLPPNGSNILEVGCGNVEFLKQLSSLGKDYILNGCDLNQLALNLAEPGNFNLYVYNVFEKQKSLHEKFDALFLMDVIEHIEHDVDFLLACSHHIKPGGFIYINVPANQLLFSKYDEVAGHKRRYSKDTLQCLVQDGGFVIKKVFYWGFFLLPIALMRKFALQNVDKNKVISKGFQPSSHAINYILQTLRTVEGRITLEWPAGTSLMCIAEKKK